MYDNMKTSDKIKNVFVPLLVIWSFPFIIIAVIAKFTAVLPICVFRKFKLLPKKLSKSNRYINKINLFFDDLLKK